MEQRFEDAEILSDGGGGGDDHHHHHRLYVDSDYTSDEDECVDVITNNDAVCVNNSKNDCASAVTNKFSIDNILGLNQFKSNRICDNSKDVKCVKPTPISAQPPNGSNFLLFH